MRADRKAWFGPKAYGYGFTPTTWEGWLLTAALLAAVAAAVGIVGPLFGPLALAGAVTLCLGLYIWIASRRTAGDMAWRWGDRDRR
ncbi:MAG: hypothetical protein ACK4YQ_16535 [Phenylobacterium sp.]|uniref:hypothetical protein n=1 Tax=Phenylobacterium sp. TaxID=1871053 RepID=UPI00391AA120